MKAFYNKDTSYRAIIPGGYAHSLASFLVPSSYVTTMKYKRRQMLKPLCELNCLTTTEPGLALLRLPVVGCWSPRRRAIAWQTAIRSLLGLRPGVDGPVFLRLASSETAGLVIHWIHYRVWMSYMCPPTD